MHTHDGKTVDVAGSDISSVEERAHRTMGALEGSLSQVATALFEIDRHNVEGSSSKTFSEMLTRCVQAHDAIQTRLQEMREALAGEVEFKRDP